jgi:hypothetical protein
MLSTERLETQPRIRIIASMKFLGAIAAYLVIGSVLAWGILLAVHGNYWLLAVGLLVYVIAFAKLGCLPPGKSH